MRAKGKNNIYCKYGNIAHMLHIIPRPHNIECIVYPNCDPKQSVTIGYFDTDTFTWTPHGKEFEWVWPKRMMVAILYHHYKVASAFYRMVYNKLQIEYIGKQEVFNNG